MSTPALLLLAACAVGFQSFDSDDDTDASADTDTDTLPDTDEGAESGLDDDTDETDDTEDSPTTADPMIVEVCDGADAPWKFVEIYNPGTSERDLTGFFLEKYSNGASSPTGSLDLAGVRIPGRGVWVVGFEGQKTAFQSAFGRAADTWSQVVDGNGDDAYALSEGSDRRDVFGEPGVDGTGEDWEYEDACARRRPAVTVARPVWLASEWEIPATENPFERN